MQIAWDRRYSARIAMLTDRQLLALFGLEFFARTLAPELQVRGLLPSMWGLWGLSYSIALLSSRALVVKLAGLMGLIAGITCSDHPLLVGLSFAAAAWISFALVAELRAMPGLLVASAAVSLSFLSKALFWALLAMTGTLSAKPLFLELLIKRGPALWAKRASVDGLGAFVAWRLCSWKKRAKRQWRGGR